MFFIQKITIVAKICDGYLQVSLNTIVFLIIIININKIYFLN